MKVPHHEIAGEPIPPPQGDGAIDREVLVGNQSGGDGMFTPEGSRTPGPVEVLWKEDRVQLGNHELALCGAIDVADVQMVLVDAGSRRSPNGYGPFKVDPTGEELVFSHRYALVSKRQTPDGPEFLSYSFMPGEEVEIGRGNPRLASDLQLTGKVSEAHARLVVHEDKVEFQDLGSTNGSWFGNVYGESANEARLARNRAEFPFTVNIDSLIFRAGRGNELELGPDKRGWGYGVFDGRPKIARDTPINGGVYPVGGTHGEAIVVDDKKYPGQLNRVYQQLLNNLGLTQRKQRLSAASLRHVSRAVREPSEAETAQVLQKTFDVVSDALQYDLKKTDMIARDYASVSLGKYVAEGVGVCRTQGLLVAYLLERLVKDGRLQGTVSIDRNTIDELDGTQGAHAWARFTRPNGEVFIIDPAQKFVGSLKEAQRRMFGGGWDYRRTEDILASRFKAVA